jgi:hypothetical protein
MITPNAAATPCGGVGLDLRREMPPPVMDARTRRILMAVDCGIRPTLANGQPAPRRGAA